MNCPNHRTISGRMLEKMILAELNAIVSQYCQADELRLTGLCGEQLRALERTLSRLRVRHESAQNRLIQLYKDKADGLISAADYTLLRQTLTGEE